MDRKIRYYASKLWFFIISVILLLYFIYHIFSGNYGFFAWRHLEKDLQEKRMLLNSLEEQHRKLDNKVSLLKTEHIDPDMLDERVRTMLNTGAESEIVVLN